MKEKLAYLKELLLKYQMSASKDVIQKRIEESDILGEEYAWLKINKQGLLIKPFMINNSPTRDKVLASAHINGIKRLDKLEPGSNADVEYYIGYNEILEKVGRITINRKER